MAHKGEVYHHFQVYKSWAQNATGCTIQTLRSDGGGEYRSNEFLAFLAQAGIHHEYTAAHTSQQNGVRRHRIAHGVLQHALGAATTDGDHEPLEGGAGLVSDIEEDRQLLWIHRAPEQDTYGLCTLPSPARWHAQGVLGRGTQHLLPDRLLRALLQQLLLALHRLDCLALGGDVERRPKSQKDPPEMVKKQEGVSGYLDKDELHQTPHLGSPPVSCAASYRVDRLLPGCDSP
ncbi:uncharacterized protein LOC112347926 [Selaginella moellendorffii]|uniref:uncharacterized protein LOC112347926 n=1 Tax=Selaginella moellendorffii TaxID=88036 RepID=UPI000D1CE2DB|nr:uncharacterized protein LOC112347926 [Selaginella moellendorffii]|eukprot:XP_024535432.1 uncharacterized protein LOC112347926 [Selaginella moellendorffii]